ncbi:MAG: PhoH family protein [Verrucomicrobiales bacterium]
MSRTKRVSARKQYVLDTNVLLHDPQSLFQFEEHVIWIPVEVLEELDRFKAESTTRGANAREVHRKLSERFKTTDDMRKGVPLENGGMLRVAINAAIKYGDGTWAVVSESSRFRMLRALFPDLHSVDNRILAAAAYIADTEKPPTIVITKDLNMQLKARALGLEAQDYRTDRVEDHDIRRTQKEADEEHHHKIELVARSLQSFASEGHIKVKQAVDLPPNEYVLLANSENPGHGIPARHIGQNEFVKLREQVINIRKGRTVRAANLGQTFLLDALFDPTISLLTVYGKAGTGKTLLSVGAALHLVQSGLYEKMLITRVIMPTGRDIGFLPGRMEEKMQPWVQPAYDALEFLLSAGKKPEEFRAKRQSSRKSSRQSETETTTNGTSHQGNNGHKTVRPYEHLLHNGTIEIEAITHIRGRSLPNAIFIVDEAQQLTPHEAKTLVTRMGRGSKLILIGDLGQIDNPYVDAHTNGLVYTRSRLQGQDFMAHINLFKGERSEMADVAANLM